MKKRITIIAMIVLFGMISFVTNLAAPLGIVIREQFQVSSALGLLGNLSNFVAYAIMGIPSGKLLGRIGYKQTALWAIVVGFVGVFIQYLSGCVASFVIYLLGAFVSGFSMCMLNTVINPMLIFLGRENNRGSQLIQVAGTLYSFIGISVPILVGGLIGEITKETSIADTNVALYIAMGTFAVIGVILFLLNVQEPVYEQGPRISPLKYPHFILGCIAIFIYTGIEIGIPATMNFYLVDSSVATINAGTLVGAFSVMMLVGRSIGILMAAHFTSRQMLTFTTVLGMILIVLAIYFPQTLRVGFLGFDFPINAVFLILSGLCTSVMWGNIFDLSVSGLANSTTTASGIFMVMVCGGGIMPFLQNLLSSYIGYLNSYWLIIVALVYILFYALKGSRILIYKK